MLLYIMCQRLLIMEGVMLENIPYNTIFNLGFKGSNDVLFIIMVCIMLNILFISL